MGAWLFSGLRRSLASLRAPGPALEARLADAAGLLEAAASGRRELGLFERRGDRDPVVVAVQILREHGKTLPTAEVAKVLDHLGAVEQQLKVRRQFAVQCVVSLAILAFCVWQLGTGSPSPETGKALTGLLGALVGYWLR